MGKQPRDPLDRYYTPPALAEFCVELFHLAVRPEADSRIRYLEPYAGRGDFAHALLTRATRLSITQVVASDIDVNAPFLTRTDLPGVARMTGPVDSHILDQVNADYVVTNTAYKNLSWHIKRCRELSKRGTGLLIRQTALGGNARVRELWLKDPPTVIYHIPGRGKYDRPDIEWDDQGEYTCDVMDEHGRMVVGTEDKTDMSDGVFVVWDNQRLTKPGETRYCWTETWK